MKIKKINITPAIAVGGLILGSLGAYAFYKAIKNQEIDGYLAYWIGVLAYNQKTAQDWWNGLPYTWWWGYLPQRFIVELPDHINRFDEPKWKLLTY